jgi:hypothetical protein
MGVAHGTENEQQTALWQRLRNRLSRYDVVLAAIPLLLSLAFVVHALFPVPVHLAAGAGAFVSSVLVADVIYIHPPVNSSADP